MHRFDYDSTATLWIIPILIASLYVARRTLSSSLPLPPGPKKLPLVGNLFNIPTVQAWIAYDDLCKQYDSDIIHLNAVGRNIIVVGSATAAHDLLEARSLQYSSRPRQPMLMEVMGWSFNWSLLPYGDSWRAHRRMSNQSFNETASKKYRPQQVQATREMLYGLLIKPEAFSAHIRLMLGRTVMSIMYGLDIESEDDIYLVNAEKAMTSFTDAAIPGRYLVDVFPWLKHVPAWFPGAQFKRDAKIWREDAWRMVDAPFAETKAQIATGTARDSFVSEHLASLPSSPTEAKFHEEVVVNVAGTAYAASADTGGSLLRTFFLAMLMHPEIQAKAQAELDRVLGYSTLPTFEDEAALPYITAICKELARWRPVVPLGPPHVIDVDDSYKGYHIPKGSMVLPNIWAIFHDKTMYGLDADSFNPERFLENGQLNKSIADPVAVFGYGRRICPGRYMANASIFLAVASVLSAFTITKAVDENGAVIEPTGEYTDALFISPKPFECCIKPRSKDVAEVIKALME